MGIWFIGIYFMGVNIKLMVDANHAYSSAIALRYINLD